MLLSQLLGCCCLWTELGCCCLCCCCFSYWGAVVSGFGIFGSPILLRNLSARNYTSLTNMSLLIGFAVKGSSTRLPFFYIGYAICCAGVNGSNTHAVKAMAGGLAVKDGYGRGEYSGWVSNMRALSTALATVAYGWWYGFCVDHGVWRGSVWWLCGICGGLLPQLLLQMMPSKAFELQKAEEA